jgi:LacI family transcriptional regulator
MKRLTLEEIGEIAGVSRATVSRVINNHPNIRPEVRERVKKVIAETGYQPNLAARSLASNESKILGLIMPSILQSAFTDPYYPRLVQGISRACNENDYTVSLFLFQTEEEEERMIQRIAGNGLIGGLIVTADTFHNPFVHKLQEYQIPFVQIGRPRDEDANRISFVDVDNEAGSYLATLHLIQQGYERIAEIATAHNTAGMDRDAGYRRALSERRFPIDSNLIVYGDFSEKSGYRAMKELLPHKPDAIFIQSDAMSQGAMKALREAGLRVPDDIAIVSFDDLPLAMNAEPPLTAIRQPILHVGALAVETLIDMLKTSTEPPRHIILPVELVIRATCGAVTKYRPIYEA